FSGPIVYWNRAAEHLYGFSKQEAAGKVCHELLATEFPSLTLPSPPAAGGEGRVRGGRAAFEAVLERSSWWAGELIQTTSSGQRIVVESQARLMSEPGGKRLVLEVSRDITESKKTVEALRSSEARFRQLADAMPQIVWTAQPDGFMDYFN